MSLLRAEVAAWATRLCCLGGDFAVGAMETAQDAAEDAYRSGHSFNEAFESARDTFYRALPIGFTRPRASAEVERHDHVVQFYEGEGFLIEWVRNFIASGFEAGDAAVVVATKADRHAFDEVLRASGFALAAAREEGQPSA